MNNLCDGRKVYINGNLVEDVLDIPILKNTYKYVCKYYSMQKERDYHTYLEGDNRYSKTFYPPKSKQDLKEKRQVYYDISNESHGMLGRTPDFLNPGLMSLYFHSDFLGENKYANFTSNAKDYYIYAKNKDIFVSHASINPQIDRSKKISEIENKYSGVYINSYDRDNVYVSGAKMIVTLSPLADELLIFNMPGLKPGDEDYAIAFSVPVNTEGIKIISRKTIDKPDFSRFDYPLSNSMEEIDAYVIFEEVAVPWNRVFVFKDIDKSNQFFDKSKIRNHTGHQDITRGLVKLEFLTGTAIELANILGLNKFINIQEELGCLTSSIELIKAGIYLCEENAEQSNGIYNPDIVAIQSVRYHLPFIYKRGIDLLQKLAAGSMLAIPTHKDYNNENKKILNESLKSKLSTSEYRTKLLNLSWDITGEAFGQRQKVYEYYHAGDPMRIGASHYLNYDNESLIAKVRELLDTL